MSRWLTKEDIIKDIGKVSGVTNGFEDEFISRGPMAPPPRLMNDETEDMELLFGKQAHNAPLDVVAPDLGGITALLRQVNYDGENNIDHNSNTFSTTKKETVLEITKLNPNVAEFVPKTTRTVSDSEKKDSDDKVSEKDNTNTNSDKENDVSASKKSDVEMHKHNLIPDKKLVLQTIKNKIREKSDSNNLKDKKAKNVALAAILKLCTTPQPASNNTAPTPVQSNERPPSPQNLILLPPTHFEGPVSKNIDNDQQMSPKSPEPIEDHSKDESIDVKPLLTVKEGKPLETCDSHYNQSVQIVNDWFNTSKKPNGGNVTTKQVTLPPRSLQLNPFSFKKKSASPQSNSVSSSSNDIRKIPLTYEIPSYVPSNHAEELALEFMEKAKCKSEEDEKLLDWQSKLYLDLKKKDEEIMNKLIEHSSGNGNSTSD